MSTNEILTAEDASFLRDSIDLKALHSALKKASKPAVDLLIETLENEKLDLKTRLQVAKMLLDFQVTVAKTVSEDQMARLVAEVKLVRKPQGKIEEDEKQLGPVVDFTRIKSLE